VAGELEALRVAGQIGAPLDAIVEVYAEEGLLTKYRAVADELRFVLITSEAHVRPAAERPAGVAPAAALAGGAAWLVVRPSTATKCVRCWHLREDVGADPRHPQACARCAANVEGAGETRRFV